MSKTLTGAVLCAAIFMSQSVCLADEVRSSSVEVNTPGASSSTSVETKSDGVSQSTAVKKSKSNARGTRTSTYKAKAGPGGAKVTSNKAKVRLNEDGSVSSSEKSESHAINDAGAVHHKKEQQKTVDIDGSSSSVKTESTKSE